MNVTSDDLQKDLDAEFRQILYMIKPYINGINDHYRIEKYRVWLEKLSNASAAEKLERNKYLVELANQIHDNVLKPPFTFNPPRGPLPRLKKVEETMASGFLNTYYHQEQRQANWPSALARKAARGDCPSQTFPAKRPSVGKENPVQAKRSARSTAKGPNRPFQTIGKLVKVTRKKSETSSWYDMSESGASTVNTDVDETDKQTERLISITENSKINYRASAKSEIEALKMRMKDLIEVKNALKENEMVSEERKRTVEVFQAKLRIVEDENAELRALLELQQKKFLELSKKKDKVLGDVESKLQTENETAKRYKEHIDMLEKSHNNKLSLKDIEYHSKIENIKSVCEQKVKQLTESNALLIREKEDEIRRLKDELKNRGDYEKEQTSEHLKKCLSKLDKALHRNQTDYGKKIEKLQQELELRDIASKMKLQSQRADLIMKNTTSKQEEMKNALEGLEGKYKKMIEALHLHSYEERKRDKNVIAELKSVLQKHNIVVQ